MSDTKTMSAIQISGYGEEIDGLISLDANIPKPKLTKNDGNILVRVLAVSLAPGDCRVMSGKTSMVQGPPSFPYIPGGDLCGEVVEIHENEQKFKIGDRVVCMFDTAGPRGALAEYKLVKTSHAVVLPDGLTPENACVLPSSCLSAMLFCENNVRKGDRVLVLNGSGGVGSHLVQMLKPKGACFVDATSTQNNLLKNLGVDRVIDYRSENWWEIEDFKNEPFDLVVDLWGTKEPWIHASNSGTVKSGKNGGRYITFVGDTPYITFQRWWHVFKLMYDMFARNWWTWIFSSNPRWKYHIGLEPGNGNLDRVVKMASNGSFEAVIDSTHKFDVEGVKNAFKVQKSRHAKGKVVIVVGHQTSK